MKLFKYLLVWTIFVFDCTPLLCKTSNPYDQYYLPTNKPRWSLANETNFVEGTKNGRYLAQQDLLPGRFEMRGNIIQLTAEYFDFKYDNFAWGEYTYRFKPEQQIESGHGQKTIELINSPQLNFSDLAKAKTLNLKGEIKKNGSTKNDAGSLNFTGKPDMCEDDTRSEKYTNWFSEKVFFVNKLNAHQ